MSNLESHFRKMVFPEKQTIVITGGNSGIGFATAQYCVRLGYHVILAVRNLTRGEAAKESLLSLCPDAKVDVYLLDLSNLESIDAFARRIQQERLDINIFYCNAGIYRVPFATVFAGFESQIGVNYVANLVLFQKLEAYFLSLPHPVKFILTSSIVARFPRLRTADLYSKEKYNKSTAYQRSKLAVNYFYEYLRERTSYTNIIPLLVHPGIVFTPLIAKAYPNKLVLVIKRFLRLFFNKPEKAALSTMRLLEKDIVSPCFCGPRGIGHTAGYPKIYSLYQGNIKDSKAFIEFTLDALKQAQ